ncbi:MAG: class I SAM-dependent methyltransferase, partial [Gammaproteobacteria bacterium]
MSSDVYAAVKRFYEDPLVVARYASNDELTRGEKVILERYGDQIARADLLDIGVGAGRTTPYLMEASAAYTGIDYSEAMLERCRAKWPRARLLWCD